MTVCPVLLQHSSTGINGRVFRIAELRVDEPQIDEPRIAGPRIDGPQIAELVLTSLEWTRKVMYQSSATGGAAIMGNHHLPRCCCVVTLPSVSSSGPRLTELPRLLLLNILIRDNQCLVFQSCIRSLINYHSEHEIHQSNHDVP